MAARARLAASIRSHFAAEGFLEVEPAALQASPGAEAHLHAFSTSMIGPDGVARPAYLHTSPEFAMKKLLAAGERRIFALSRVFRNRERGALHAPEFTMFEWYRAEAPIEALMAECAVTLRLAAERISAMGAKYASILRPQLPHAFEGHCDDDATTDKATLPEGVDA